MSESDKPDAPFRNELLSMPLDTLRRFCTEVKLPTSGEKKEIVDRLMNHARKMAAEKVADRPPSTASSVANSVASLSLQGKRPGTGESFVAADAFGGAKPGYVFKQGARGLGYFRDA